ncbi:MAG: hypothetical protein PUP93_08175 [Rhizonema sp. NSF051]|nr:hypothetical protein [Rhizonema sp. NSF051]
MASSTEAAYSRSRVDHKAEKKLGRARQYDCMVIFWALLFELVVSRNSRG